MVTLQDLNRRVAINTGNYVESVTTSVGTGITDVIDTTVADQTADAASFRSWWFQALSGQVSGQLRRVSTSTTAGYTLSRGTSVATPVGTRYALYRYSPTEITRAIKQAIDESNADLYEHVVDESIVIDSLGRNPSFEHSRTALLFDGADDVVTIGAVTLINDTWVGGTVVSAWVLPFSGGEANTGIIFDKRGAGLDGWALQIAGTGNGFLRIRFIQDRATTNGDWLGIPNSLPINKWSFIAVAYTDDDVDNVPFIYQAIEDGPLEKLRLLENLTPSGNISTDAGNGLTIGNNVAGSSAFDGLIANLQIWGGERSMETIDQYRKKRLNIDPDMEPDLKLWLVTDIQAGAVAIDASGNGNDGTITGAVWAEGFDGWTYGGTNPSSCILGVNANEKIHGKASAKLTAAAGGASQLRQFIDTQGASGTRLTHKRWVRADAGTSARIGVGGTNVTTAYSGYHDGDSQLTELSVDYDLTDNDEDIFLICEAATSLVGYFDLGGAAIDKLYRYPLPPGMRRPAYVSMQDIQARPDGKFVPLNDTSPQAGRVLRIEGKRPLPTLDSLGDVLPLEDRYVNILVEKASEILMGYAAARTTGETHDRLLGESERHRDRYDSMVQNPQQRMPRLGAEVGKNWGVEGGMLILEDANAGPVFSGLPSSTVTSAGIG